MAVPADLAALALPPPDARCAATPPVDGIALGTRVMTLDGELPVEFLVPGDRIVTRAGLRALKRLDVAEQADLQRVCIVRGGLGAGRPRADVVLGAGTRVNLRDWRARLIHGAAEARLPVGNLLDGEFVVRAPGADRTRLFTLVFDQPEVFYAEGAEILSAA